MGRSDDHAAIVEMRPHHRREHALRSGIERGGRLVEQPERTIDRKEPRQRGAALLSRGQIGGRQIGDSRKSEPRQGRLDFSCRIARSRAVRQKRRPKFEIFSDGEARLQRIGMADIMAELGETETCLGRDRDLSPRQGQKAGDGAQQARFAGAIRPRHHERLAGAEPEAYIAQDDAAAAFDGESLGLDLHVDLHGAIRPSSGACPFAEKPGNFSGTCSSAASGRAKAASAVGHATFMHIKFISVFRSALRDRKGAPEST